MHHEGTQPPHRRDGVDTRDVHRDGYKYLLESVAAGDGLAGRVKRGCAPAGAGVDPRLGGVAFERIKVDTKKMGGVPIIRDLRMPVATIVNMVADGRTSEQILHDFPELELEDIKQALQFAAATLNERQVPLLSA